MAAMTIDEARRHIGEGVVYVPLHGPREDGVITAVSGGWAFVDYGRGGSVATDPADLELLAVRED